MKNINKLEKFRFFIPFVKVFFFCVRFFTLLCWKLFFSVADLFIKVCGNWKAKLLNCHNRALKWNLSIFVVAGKMKNKSLVDFYLTALTLSEIVINILWIVVRKILFRYFFPFLFLFENTKKKHLFREILRKQFYIIKYLDFILYKKFIINPITIICFFFTFYSENIWI